MIEVFKVFYPTHYNFAAVSILLVLLLIFLLSKKNFKWSIIVGVILIAFNFFIYNRTEGKVWTIVIEPEETGDAYNKPVPQEYSFSVHKNWKITDDKGKEHHWCWVETYWQKFAGLDLVSAIWGENSSKKMMQATEQRAGTIPE